MTLSKYLIKRSAIFVGMLIASALILIMITHSALDGIQKGEIEKECNDEASTMNFKTPQEHDTWVKNCITTRT